MRGRRVREVLKQEQNDPLNVAEQISILLVASEGVFDDVPLDEMAEAQQRVRRRVRERLPEISRRIFDGKKLTDEERVALTEAAVRALGSSGGEV